MLFTPNPLDSKMPNIHLMFTFILLRLNGEKNILLKKKITVRNHTFVQVIQRFGDVDAQTIFVVTESDTELFFLFLY